MKLYISSDMEGVAGVCAWQQVDARTPHAEYATYRRYYTQEVASAIEGARAGGAGGVLVNDSHGPMRNLLLDELPSDVRVIFGNRKPFSMVQDADGGFGGAFFIGYHGAAGDADAVLCHTYTPSVIYEVRVNGIRCSEATLNAGLLGFYGVPLLLATGDRTTVEGIAEQMPWVRGVIVKESIGSFAADSMVPAAAQRAIRREAEVAIAGAAAREALLLRAADHARRAARHCGASASRRNDPKLRTHRLPQRSLRARFLSGRLQSVRRNLAPRRNVILTLRLSLS